MQLTRKFDTVFSKRRYGITAEITVGVESVKKIRFYVIKITIHANSILDFIFSVTQHNCLRSFIFIDSKIFFLNVKRY